MSKKGLIHGGESTSHDSGNDILYTVEETGQQVLIEGDEYHLCKASLMNNDIHEYKNKTNKEILDDIYTRSSCMVKEGEANVGDFIICKLAVRDKTKRNLTGTIAEIVSIMQKEHGCRVVDGAEYEKMKKGGYVRLSKTPAPKKERIYGSERNPKGTSESGKSAESIEFSESTLNAIKNKVEEHNKKHPEKKITLDIAKAVVRRGMGAYSSTHRPTIKGGKPNSRVAWGIARLNAFIYKVVNGKSKSGRYSEDNDLLHELGIKHSQFADGGTIDKRYVAEADFYVNAKNDDQAKKEANEVAKLIDDKYDNKATVNHLYEIYGGIGNSRKVFKDGGEVNINVFHGSSRKFNEFDFSKLGESTSNSTAKEGFWFTDDISTAKSYPTSENWRKVDKYIKEGKNKLAEKLENEIFENKDEKYIYNVSLSFSNPMVIDADGNVYNEFEDEIKNAIKEAKKNNNDVLIVKNLSDSADYSEYLPSTHYLVFDNKVIKNINSIKEFEEGGSFQPPYPINSSGGYDYKGEAKETAKKVDLLTLPKNVNGTHCGNCFFYEQGICVHKDIMLPVTDRMCCSVWDNSNSERSYEKNIENDKAQPKNDIQTFPKNKDGGYTYSGEALKIAEKFDLITLPKNIEGTNCANCSWYTPYKDGGFCFRSNIQLPVNARMSCAFWNSLSVKRDWGFFEQGGEINKNKSSMEVLDAEIQDYYTDVFASGGEIKAKNIITEKIGLDEANASFLIEQSPKFAIWMADNILKDVMKKMYLLYLPSEYKTDELLGKQIPKLTQPFLKEKALEEINRFNFINRNYRTQIRLILDWLQHPITPTQNLRELSIDSAFEKAQIFHEELKVIGGDIDFKEAEGNIVLKNYPKNSEGLSYYWVLIPKNFCELESSRMGHCGRTGYGNILISLRSVKPYGSGHTISDSHVTIAYGNSDGYFYQVKGKKNQKPSEKYYEYIYDLIVSMLSKDLGLESLDFLSQEINKLNVAIENIESEFNKKINEVNERGHQIATIEVIAFNDATKILKDKKEILENKLSKIEQIAEVGFDGFGSEYSTSEDYGWADMTFEQFTYLIKLKPELANEINVNDLSKEQVKVIYELSPDTFKGLVGEIVLYENDLGEAPKTTFILEMKCDSVGSLLKQNGDIAERIICGEFYEIYDSYFRSEQEIIDYILDDIDAENEKTIVKRISEIAGLPIEKIAEEGIKYYLSGEYLEENDSIEFDFSGIFNAINRAYSSAEESDYYDHFYKELKDSLSEYGNVIEMNDSGVEIEVDLGNYLSYKQIKEIAKDIETEDLEDIFNEELNKSIELSNFILDNYYPDANSKLFNEILAEEELEYKKGGAIKSKKHKKVSTSSFKMPSRKIYEYAEKIRKEYPEIWDMGGNVFGNEAYKNLEKVIKRGYWKPEEEWMYKKWQSFMARHEGDFRIAGVIANLKWLNWVEKGREYSQSIINQEIKRLELNKMAHGGEISSNRFETFLKNDLANRMFGVDTFYRKFTYRNDVYRVDFLITTTNDEPDSANMLIFKEIEGGDDVLVLDLPFDFENFNFDLTEYYKMFGKPSKKMDKGGVLGISDYFFDFKYPSLLVPSSYFIPESIKKELANKRVPKQKYSFPFNYSLNDAEDVFKKIIGKDDLRPAMNGIYLMGDVIAATDAHKLAFIGMNKSQYGAHWFGYPSPNKDDRWVQDVDKEEHGFYRILPESLDKGDYKHQGSISIPKLYQYITFLINNPTVLNRTTYMVKMKYKNTSGEKDWIGVNAKYLKDVLDIYLKFGILNINIYIARSSKAILLSINRLDSDKNLIKQLKNNIFILLMPLMISDYYSSSDDNSDIRWAAEDLDFNTACGIYYDLSEDSTYNVLGQPDNMLSTSSILSESEFQLTADSFKKIFNNKKKQYGKTLLEIIYPLFISDFSLDKGINDKKYSEMSNKEVKLAVALAWAKSFLY